MKTLLIANRGEIARRVIRTARAMGIRTIAIHTDADALAPHVRDADESVLVPSYLDIDAVVAAAQDSGAEAIHPGYGFLSERSAFAQAVEDAGLTLVGPSARVMNQMGRKDAAREIAVAAGVPVVPSYDLDSDPATFDYPVLVKAAAGGGGKGMRIVNAHGEFAEAVEAAKREARSAFGDDAMLIEKYVESGRHIEVQVMADSHGHVLHLFERDCSTQRRHQKVLEEAPAPTISAEQRELVLSSAVALAAQVGYVNAGTVEFLLDNDSGAAYFLEMNTRLQVEHPVTELITGLDLVELQLRVASGEELPITQDGVRCEGHAIEARVYAEDSFGGFLPQAGTATYVLWPDGVRVDEALETGQEVTTGFDPMLGKVIAYAENRELARQELVDALDRTAILGLTTNTGFLRVLAASDEFRDATIDTAWLDHHEVAGPTEDDARALAGIRLGVELDRQPRGPWEPDGFRIAGPRGPLVEDGHLVPTTGFWSTLSAIPGSSDVVRVGSAAHGDGFVRRTTRGSEVVVRGQRFDLPHADPFRAGATAADEGSLTAPMPGTVLAVDVSEGDVVEEGQRLGVLEAMKMELALRAPYAGTVTTVGHGVGDQVKLGALLFEVSDHE